MMEDDKIDLNELADFEDEVSAHLEDAPLAPSGTKDLSADDATALEATSSPVEERPAPQYGAPQSLFEDIIPAGFTKEDLYNADDDGYDKKAEAAAKRAEKAAERAEKEAEKAEKEAEKEAEKAAKKQEKEDKKRAKTAALIAKVEADAVRQAKAEIKRESGEDYEVKESSAPKKASTTQQKASSDLAPKKRVGAAPKEFSREEKKLRREYQLSRDLLLSSNNVVPGFVIAKGETVIRTYRCLAAKGGDGTLCLTNKRLLVNAGERSEIDIDKVSGIKFSKYTNFSFLKFFLWFLFFLAGGFMIAFPILYGQGITFSFMDFITKSWADWKKILFFVVGGIFLVVSLPFLFTMVRKTFYFYIYAREDAPFLECKSRACAKREQQGKSYRYTVSKAGKDSEKAARELGALIIEAKEGRYNF